jgi:hypothetical protein
MVGRRRASQKPLTKLARGRECEIRLVGICNGDPRTTVPCHFRMLGLSGGSYIPDAIFVAHGCSACHAYVDTHKDAETQLDFAKAVFRTQQYLLDEGKITWKP